MGWDQTTHANNAANKDYQMLLFLRRSGQGLTPWHTAPLLAVLHHTPRSTACTATHSPRIDMTLRTLHSLFRVATACGDGIVNGGETCDDGNTAAHDGCSPTCTLEGQYQTPQIVICAAIRPHSYPKQ